MGSGKVVIYYGKGRGKTGAAVGRAVHMAGRGKSGVIIQFLKQKEEEELSFFQRLEPELKLFRFARYDCCFDELSRVEKKEETLSLKNALNYSRKVITTGGCDVMILDEVLGLVDLGIATSDEIAGILDGRPDDMTIILTGRKLDDDVRKLADEVYNISKE